MVKVGKNKAQPFTEIDRISWNEFVRERTLQIHNQQRKMICKLYSKTFNLPLRELTKDENQRPLFKMIDKLDKVFESDKKNKY